jgi:hypothetical protein
MRNETLLSLLDVLDELALGYKECAQKIYAAENALLEQQDSEVAPKLCSSYFQIKRRVMSGEPGLGTESERWNESAEGIETALATLRRKLSQSLDEEK